MDDLLYSNGGHGPLVARIIRIADGVVELERRHKRGKRWTPFKLPEDYFHSEKCGWKYPVRP